MTFAQNNLTVLHNQFYTYTPYILAVTLILGLSLSLTNVCAAVHITILFLYLSFSNDSGSPQVVFQEFSVFPLTVTVF